MQNEFESSLENQIFPANVSRQSSTNDNGNVSLTVTSLKARQYSNEVNQGRKVCPTRDSNPRPPEH